MIKGVNNNRIAAKTTATQTKVSSLVTPVFSYHGHNRASVHFAAICASGGALGSRMDREVQERPLSVLG